MKPQCARKFTTLDVRDLLARGEEPRDHILAAVAALGADEGLLLIAPFMPAPLIERLHAEGFRSGPNAGRTVPGRHFSGPSSALRPSAFPMSSSALLPPCESAALSLAASTPAASHSIVSRTLLVTPELRVLLFNFAAGQSLTEHTNPARAVVQVLAGACEFTVDGRVHALRAGDLLHFPPTASHAVTATEPLTMLLTLASPQKPK